ncbi:hypothetical protein [Campylobacter showae]
MAKVGFNNLKAFGENLQKFSYKPIALVYGPNSSGKSSFLYAMFYENTFKTTEIQILKGQILPETSWTWAGLKIFIHKHDTNRTVISYAYEFAGSKGDYTTYGEEGKNIMD